eukprot:scaffold3127_cov202-Prasinococcus_capsulatus_cf.AAC.10
MSHNGYSRDAPPKQEGAKAMGVAGLSGPTVEYTTAPSCPLATVPRQNATSSSECCKWTVGKGGPLPRAHYRCRVRPTSFRTSSTRITGAENAITSSHSFTLSGTILNTLARTGT